MCLCDSEHNAVLFTNDDLGDNDDDDLFAVMSKSGKTLKSVSDFARPHLHLNFSYNHLICLHCTHAECIDSDDLLLQFDDSELLKQLLVLCDAD